MSETRADSALVPAEVRRPEPIGRFREFVRGGGQQYLRLFRRAPITVLVATAAFLAVTLVGAYAAWMSSSQSTASVTAATVDAGTAPTVGYNGTAVEISWAPVSLSDGSPVDRYDVIRHVGASTAVVCTATAPATSCLDASPLVGTVQYGVVGRMSQNWTGPESPLTSFTSDQALPTTNASTSPAPNAAGWNKTNVDVTLNVTDSGASGVRRLTYRIGAAAPVTVNGASTTFPVNVEGTTSVIYYAEDNAGNVEATKSLTLKIDKTAPNAPGLAAISNDTGSSSTDRITSAASQMVSGTAEANATVTVVRGGVPVGSGTADGAGNFSIPVTLVEGVNSLTATATDVAGNVSGSSLSFAVTLDTAAPLAPSLSSISDDTGVSSSDRITSVAGQTVMGTAEAYSSVTVRRGGSTVGTAMANGSGMFSAAVTLVEGVNTLSATATDLAGNVSGSSSNFAVTLDTVAPAAPVLSSISNDTGVSSTDQITSVAGQTVAGTAEANSSVTIRRGGSTVATATTNGSGAFSAAVTLVEGVNTLTATAADVAGNVSGSSSNFAVTLDTTNPVTTASVSPTPNAAGWNKTAVTVTLTASDTSGSGVQRITYQIGAATPVSVSGSSTSFPISAEGSTTISFWATDVAGNAETSKNTVVRIDTVAPSTPSITAISNDTGVSSTDRITNAASQTISGTAEANSTVAIIRGGSTLATGTANGSGAFSIPVTLVDGTNTLTATATDIAGNTSAASGGFVVRVDRTAPAAAITFPVHGGSYKNNEFQNGCSYATKSICGTASDPLSAYVSGIDKIELELRNVDDGTCLEHGGAQKFLTGACATRLPVNVAAQWSYATPTLARANYSTTVWVTDIAGNVTTSTVTFFMQ